MNTKKNGEKEKKINPQSNNDSSLTKMIYIILLYVFYLFGGLYNEKLTKTEYEYKDINNQNKIFKFKYPSISLCFPSILSFVISSFMLKKMKNKYFSTNIESPISFHDKSIIGIMHIISSFSAQTALIYLDFIVKTIGKSCKSASIMFIYFLNTIPFCNSLLKKLLNNKKSNEDKKDKILIKDVIKVLMTTTSVILFNLSSDSKNNSKKNEQSSSYFGITILLISLFTDGLLSLKENMIKSNITNDKKYEGYNNLLSWEYMNIFSFFTFSFSFCQILFKIFFGDYGQIFKIIFSNKILMKDLASYAVFDVLGQSVLYIFLGKYGPLALSMVTCVRKILSISISILYFGKSISFSQSISLFLASSIIFWEIYEKGNKNKITKSKKIE
jgi:hypothetical protein